MSWRPKGFDFQKGQDKDRHNGLDANCNKTTMLMSLSYCCCQRLDTGTNVLSSHTELPFLAYVSLFRNCQMVVSDYHFTWISVYVLLLTVLQFQNHNRCITCLYGTNWTRADFLLPEWITCAINSYPKQLKILAFDFIFQ